MVGLKEQRISNMENVKVRMDLDVLEKIAKSLEVSVDFLIDAELERNGKECLYLVWGESVPSWKIYVTASSKRKAFLLYDNPDMTKIIQELISLLEEQEKVKIDYELEKTA